ncbi:MAG TPA: response regulator [Anaerolineae bacterium]|nr:response regulator [Anaerolineae bacterium]MCB0179001.1 response regulator [Anaerolineae bacterium]MCB0226553.1 response regulator [Anaerolineae bacterium]MCB9108012.1 response regulator [Anaerolineales bacterium]HRV92151.1 response regulator [Anaerolineae bacterium]
MIDEKNLPRVLYVEDEKDLRDPISQMLEFLGYEVDCAVNGAEGVEKAESWQPDFILMDIRMPKIDGFEATRRLRSNPVTNKIPIFILSAYDDAKTRASCREVGADGFFSKPADIEKIDATIRRTLGRVR